MLYEVITSDIDHLFQTFVNQQITLTTLLKKLVFSIDGDRRKQEIQFRLSDFDRALVEAGGWLEYADRHY